MQNFLYTRVSTNDQGPESLSVQNQICLNYLNSEGLTLSESFQEIGSAYKGNQKILNKILNEYSNCKVFVLNVSRFSRNILNGMEMLKKAEQKNITFHFIEEGLLSNNKHHHHQIRMKLLEFQNESETISNRQLNLNKIRVKSGWKFGVAKFGRKAEIINGIRKFRIDDSEKKITEFIIQAREGISCKSLNSKLKKIKPNADPINFYDKDGITLIKYFEKPNSLSFSEIAYLLNDYNICKRGKPWTASKVSIVYEKATQITGKMKEMNLNV